MLTKLNQVIKRKIFDHLLENHQFVAGKCRQSRSLAKQGCKIKVDRRNPVMLSTFLLEFTI